MKVTVTQTVQYTSGKPWTYREWSGTMGALPRAGDIVLFDTAEDDSNGGAVHDVQFLLGIGEPYARVTLVPEVVNDREEDECPR